VVGDSRVGEPLLDPADQGVATEGVGFLLVKEPWVDLAEPGRRPKTQLAPIVPGSARRTEQTTLWEPGGP
jgi:hypothetical protein